jgi:hypothetical protein
VKIVAVETHSTIAAPAKSALLTAQSSMAVLIPRIRTINVRLSEEEYLELERFCVASGARSISDLVRSTMHGLVTSRNQDNSLASSVIEYSGHVKDLELRVKELAAELESFRTSDRPHHVDDTGISSGSGPLQPMSSEKDS